MSRQDATGRRTEASVMRRLRAIGLDPRKPVPDDGIDLEVRLPKKDRPVILIQVKGRGPKQSSGKYRWFQVRTTAAQRRKAASLGSTAADTWEKKVKLCDFFVLVSLKYREFWVIPSKDIIRIGRINRNVYGSRADNRSGQQAELDLDVEHKGKPLTGIYAKNLNAFGLVKKALRKKAQSVPV